ncbi:MAG TPA: GSU2403 family nucleotidyltransferase fold protein [Rhizomicrobium sp.]|jgi:hypothetical protein|nr:GSU2403 family nucleotidyltransferase fold protein [Rhizomicrobium sp.]
MSAPALILQTTYAELLERSVAAAFGDAFAEEGTFVAKEIRNRRYWYFQTATAAGRTQKYVGPDSAELRERIARHRHAHDDARERRALVSTLTRSFGMPRPPDEMGKVIAGLARAGVFRLRGVLVGTSAYQTYAAMLGMRLPVPTLQTGDVDIAQFRNLSIAVDDRTLPALGVLRHVDKSFRAIPHGRDARRATSYIAGSGLRVDFLTPNEGPDTDEPQPLRALGTDAEPLRFLDFLIHDPEQAAVLFGTGVPVQVPRPERFAIHKLIVSQRRRAGTAKQDKDLHQAQTLLPILAHKFPDEVKNTWSEAIARGPGWQKLLLAGMARLSLPTRDVMLKAVDAGRSALPGIDLIFSSPRPHYDFDRDVVMFNGDGTNGVVRCEVSREALEDHFGADGLSKEGRIEKFQANRSAIESMARIKYLHWPVEEPGVVLIRTGEVEALRRRNGGRGR